MAVAAIGADWCDQNPGLISRDDNKETASQVFEKKVWISRDMLCPCSFDGKTGIIPIIRIVSKWRLVAELDGRSLKIV